MKKSTFVTVHTMKAYRKVEVLLQSFLTMAVDGSELLDSLLYRCTSVERAPTIIQIGCWVDPRGGLDALEKRRIFCLYWEENRIFLVAHPVA